MGYGSKHVLATYRVPTPENEVRLISSLIKIAEDWKQGVLIPALRRIP